MIRLPSDYEQAKGYDGNFPKLTKGGHICRITNSTLQTSKAGNEMLVVCFDINEPGELGGYYKKVYDIRCRKNAYASWPGTYYVPISNSDGTTNTRFKGLINAVEQSNSNYKFNGDEKALVGKLVGFNFGEEEYQRQDTEEVRTRVRASYAVSIERVRNGIEPPPLKRLDGTSARPVPVSVAAAAPDDEDDELPF